MAILNIIPGAIMKTDAQIQQDVANELAWEPAVNAAGIGVEVHGGTVTLAGHVDNYGEKLAAEQAAQRVAGVKGLTVEIDVTLNRCGPRSDIDIAKSVESALQWVTYLPKDALKIMVEKGWLTLSGSVDWAYQRENAKAAVRYLSGVKGIIDDISLKPSAASTLIKSEIEAALQRRFDSEDQAIAVAVKDGEVTLSGTVTNWWQREMARDSAWNAAGVRNVNDKLTIDY